MSAGTFTPRPGGAPLLRQVLTQASMEARLMLRNGEQLMVAVVIPVIILIGGVKGGQHLNLKEDHPLVDIFVPGVLALAIMSTSFTALAIATGFERRYGVIKRLGASPLSRLGLLTGKIVALVAVEILQLFIIGGVGQLLGWSPKPGFIGFLLAIILGTAAFAALGLFIAGALRAEATLAVANLVYLLLMAGGAVVLPAHTYGGFGAVTHFLPSGALGEAMRETFLDQTVAWGELGVLAVWAALGAALTAKTFTWE
ncbi:ABC transporter permease [Nocardioides sp.]|uniref:ABC transporter permease n=1 Tax=Nocardioides sp. TaxID=35761 RepID=UPI002627318A|nr:ABC transporter permease [Nocardioides sp.]